MGVIFKEHAMLEWRAPAIDGRVCHIWRQIVLNTPRAWVYLEISDEVLPTIRELREWLDRSGSAPLYIRVNKKFTFHEHLKERPLHDLLSSYHTRIASLRLHFGDPSFFERRDFPCLRVLDISRWYSMGSPLCPVRWDSMLSLQSLHLAAATKTFPLQWSELPPLEALNLFSTRLTSPPKYSLSLTTLMLDGVSIGDAISSPIAFPSLTYLSLYEVIGLKPYINAPCLITYHEGGCQESFSSPLPSLVEYGVYCPSSNDTNPARWHRSFPNMSRLSIRGPSFSLVSFFRSLSHDPYTLPALQTISAGSPNGPFTEKEQAIIRNLVRVRGEACQTHVMLYFDMKEQYKIPIYFGEVSHCISKYLRVSNVHSRTRKLLTEGRRARTRAWHINPPHTRTREALQKCRRAGYHSRMTSLMKYDGKINFQYIRVPIKLLSSCSP
jgi:hypothetical protein